MIATAKRPPTATLVPSSAIEQATLALQSLPEKPREEWSMREAVDHMRDGITAALAKGYNYDEVAVMLSERGVQISPSSLKYYLTRVKRNERSAPRPRGSDRTTQKSKKTAAETPVAVSPAPEEPKVEAPAEKPSTTTKTSKSRPATPAKTVPAPAPEATSTKTRSSTRSTSGSKAKSDSKASTTPAKSDSTASKKPGTTRRKQTV